MGTFEVSDTVSQLPPVRENFPEPIRSRISSGVSFGPLANGVYLTVRKGEGEVRETYSNITFIIFMNTSIRDCGGRREVKKIPSVHV